MRHILFITGVSVLLIIACNNHKNTGNLNHKNSEENREDTVVSKSGKSQLKQETEQSSQNRKQNKEQSKYICKGFLLNSVQLYLFDTIQGNIIDSIKNDTVAEAYYIVTISKKQDQWVKINTKAINTEKSGWIKFQGNYFGVYGANYTNDLKLYNKPDTTSNIVHSFPSQYPRNPLKILDWQNNWRKVKVNNIIGWVRKERVCPTPYTTCN